MKDKYAQAAYEAAMTLKDPAKVFEPWQTIPEYWKRIYRAQAEAILRLHTADAIAESRAGVVAAAWTDSHGKPAAHRTKQEVVRMNMPGLARALDQLVKESN